MMNYAILGGGDGCKKKMLHKLFIPKTARTGLEAKMLAKIMSKLMEHGSNKKHVWNLSNNKSFFQHVRQVFKKVEMGSSSNQKLEQTTSMYPTGN